MNSFITKIFTTFIIFGIFLSSPSFGAVAPDQIDYKGNTITKHGQGHLIDPCRLKPQTKHIN